MTFNYNLYVFNSFPISEPPKPQQLNHLIETSNLLKTEQKIKKRKEEVAGLDYTFVSNRVPKRFVDFVKSFFPEAKVIEEYWHMVHILAFDYRLHEETDVIVDLAIDSFRQLIRKLKFTNKVRNKIAYFYGILKEKFFEYQNEWQREQVQAGLMKVTPSPFVYDGTLMEYEWLHSQEGVSPSGLFMF